jgi:hypothetical protein
LSIVAVLGLSGALSTVGGALGLLYDGYVEDVAMRPFDGLGLAVAFLANAVVCALAAWLAGTARRRWEPAATVALAGTIVCAALVAPLVG